MDLKNVLSDNAPKETKKPASVSVHKKPIQLRDIESRSSSKTRLDKFESKEQMTELLNKEKHNIYKQNWNKLDKGMKINRLKEFISRETKEKQLNIQESHYLSDLLLSACSNNKLNRVNDVVYNKDDGIIENIKILSCNNKKYELKINENKQTRSTGKAKSNIERFLRSAK